MDKNAYFEHYNARTHLYGRLGLLATIVLMLASPFVMGLFLGAAPNMGAFVKGFAQGIFGMHRDADKGNDLGTA